MLGSQAGRQEPMKRHLPFSGEQARGLQHEVKLAASTEEQSGSRAAHVTAKATPEAPVSERAAGPGGVRSATREQGEMRNTRGPSAWPKSGQSASYKPKVKAAAAQRESEGFVVPKIGAQVSGTNAVQKNAAGGKGPWGGQDVGAGKREGMAAKSGPKDPGGAKPREEVRKGRNLRRGDLRSCSRERLHNLGLHRLRGTIRYPEAA
jgi:hypothetical protein